MFELLKKGFYALIGGAVLSGKKVEALKKSAAHTAADSEKEGRKFVRKLADSCAPKPIVDEKIEEILKRKDVPDRKELTDLELRIRKLEEHDRMVPRS